MKKSAFVLVIIFSLILSSCDDVVINEEEGLGEIPELSFTVEEMEVLTENVDWESFVSFVSGVSIEGYSIRVNPDNVNLEELGEYQVQVEILKDKEVIKEESFRVSVVDSTSPQIDLTIEEEVYIEQNQIFEEPEIHYSDNYDTNVSLTKIGQVDTSVIGDYTITYVVEDASGNTAEVSILVHVIERGDTEAPELTLIGEEEIVLELGNYYQDEGVLATDDSEGEIDVLIHNLVNYYQVGNYTIQYIATDEAGNQSSITRRVEIIGEIENPSAEEYFKVYPSETGSIVFRNMIETSNNNFVVIGEEGPFGSVMLMDEYGEILWQVLLGDPELGSFSDFYGVVEVENHLFVVGTIFNHTTFFNQGYMAKLTMDGQVVEEYQDQRYSDVYYHNVFVDDEGYLLISGNRTNQEPGYTGDKDWLFELSKLTTSFEEVWRIVSGSSSQEYTSFKQVDDRYILIGAMFNSYVREFTKYGDSSLPTYYFSQYGTNQVSMMDSNGDVVGAYYNWYSTDQGIVKDNGLEVFEASFDEFEFSIRSREIVELPNGNYMVVGRMSDFGSVNEGQVIILEYTKELVYVKHRIIPGNLLDSASGVLVTSKGEIVIYGSATSDDGFFEGYDRSYKGFILKTGVDWTTLLDEDKEKPEIHLHGQQVVYIGKNQEYVDLGVEANDNATVDPTFEVYSNVDTTKEGTYEVYYVAKDEANNANIIRRTVIVVEEVPEDQLVLDLQTLAHTESYLYEQISYYDSNTDGYLSTSEIERITSLVFVHGPIHNTSILNYFPNLLSLNIKYQELEDIGFLENLVNLEYLDLSHNQIEDISTLSSLTNLRELILGFNNISDVSSIHGLDQLVNLRIPYNNIDDISVIGPLPLLEKLVAYNNQLTDIDTIADYPNLQVLELTGNQISSMQGIGTLTQLTELYINVNNISDISELSTLVNLENIKVNDNQITDICPLSTMVKLRSLNFRDNQVTNIDCLDQLVLLEGLHMINNPIEDIQIVANFTFLELFDMNAEQITDIAFFLDLEHLQSVGLRGIIVTPEIQSIMDQLIDQGIEVYHQ